MSARHALPFWLHSRYVPAVGLALAGLLLLAAAGLLGYERQELQQTLRARDDLYARVLEDQTNRTFNGVELALGAAADNARLQRDEGAAQRLSPLLQQSMQALPFLRSISLVDAKGQVLASSSPANEGLQIPRQRLLAASRPGGGLGPLLPGRDLADLARPASSFGSNDGKLHMLPLVRPLAAEPDSDWLVATLNPDYFANQYGLLLDGLPLQATLLSYDGQLLVPAAGSLRKAGEWLKAHALFAQALPSGREQGTLAGPGLDGDSVFSAYRSVRQQPLVVLVETPEAVLHGGLRELTLGVAGVTLALLALMGGVGFMAWRSLRGHEAVSSDLLAVRGSLAAQDAFTDRLFQVSPIPMVVKDTDGRFLRVNQAWTGLTGIAADRAVGQNLGRLYPAHLAAPHEVQEQLAIASQQPLSYEEQILDSDGLPRDVMLRVTPFTDADGDVAGVITCLMDVTEFREAALRTTEAKEAAEHANAAKTEFLANISHELRTPLQSILGFSELGAARSQAEPRLKGMFDSIHEAGQRMLVLVNNLLDLSRLDSTVGEIQLQPQDITPALQAVVAELQGLAQARGLQLKAPPAEAQAPMWAAADAFRLQQVLRNVLANAIRFAPPHSAIEIDWCSLAGEGEGDGLPTHRVSVRDHGPGIPADETERIFEAFVQSSRTKDGSGGTGLGLAICRRIIAGHHGSIRADNHPGGGAVFSFSLPAQAAHEVAAAQAAQAGQRAQGQPA